MSDTPRFKVTTCEGWTIHPGSGTSSCPPGLTASVLDTHVAHREVARFRSEDSVAGVRWGGRLGHEGARQAAQEYADTLNNSEPPGCGSEREGSTPQWPSRAGEAPDARPGAGASLSPSTKGAE